eukprot:RCo007638
MDMSMCVGVISQSPVNLVFPTISAGSAHDRRNTVNSFPPYPTAQLRSGSWGWLSYSLSLRDLLPGDVERVPRSRRRGARRCPAQRGVLAAGLLLLLLQKAEVFTPLLLQVLSDRGLI